MNGRRGGQRLRGIEAWTTIPKSSPVALECEHWATLNSHSIAEKLPASSRNPIEALFSLGTKKLLQVLRPEVEHLAPENLD